MERKKRLKNGAGQQVKTDTPKVISVVNGWQNHDGERQLITFCLVNRKKKEKQLEGK